MFRLAVVTLLSALVALNTSVHAAVAGASTTSSGTSSVTTRTVSTPALAARGSFGYELEVPEYAYLQAHNTESDNSDPSYSGFGAYNQDLTSDQDATETFFLQFFPSAVKIWGIPEPDTEWYVSATPTTQVMCTASVTSGLGAVNTIIAIDESPWIVGEASTTVPGVNCQ